MPSSILTEAQAPHVLRGYLAGLTLSTTAPSAAFTVAAGMCANSTNSDYITLATTLQKNTSAWTAGAAGALDTGTIAASTWYHVFLIKNPTTAAVDVLVSLSATAPTLPSGFTLFRRIGSMKTNASSQWVAFTQTGDYFEWSAPTQDVNVTGPGTSAINRTLNAPTGVSVIVNLGVYTQDGVSGGVSDVRGYVWPTDSTKPPTSNVGGYSGSSSITAAYITTLPVRTSIGAQVATQISVASSTLILIMQTFGWTDRRGRDI